MELHDNNRYSLLCRTCRIRRTLMRTKELRAKDKLNKVIIEPNAKLIIDFND